VILVKDRIKKVRQHENVNLSQEAFGKRLGVTGAGISKIESGDRNASEQIILGICREFDVNETWLRTGEGEMFVPLSRSQEISTFVAKILKGEEDTFKRRFVAMLSRLDENDWEVLEKMVNEMKKD